MQTAEYWINQLELQAHPEGGYFKESYKSDEQIEESQLPERYSTSRHFSTSIYYLLEGEQFSSFHRLNSDEIWYHHCGSDLQIYIIDEQGNLRKEQLGLHEDAHPQICFKRNWWFGAKVADPQSYTLLGCMVAPGFEFSDFELGQRDQLITQFPEHKTHITQLTHK